MPQHPHLVMNIGQATKEIERLTKIINHHNDLYYRKNTLEISDVEFDQLMQQLMLLEKKFPTLKFPDSPTQRVGGSITKTFPSVKHTYNMLSLGNTYEDSDLMGFDQRVSKRLGQENYSYTCELKFDGVSISIIYEHGMLIKGITRGDGIYGDDITANVKTIRSIPLRIAEKGIPNKFEVRGEILLPKIAFQQLNKQRERADEEPYSNARNTTSGTLKMQDSAAVAKRKLDCYAYSLLGTNLSVQNHYEAIRLLEVWGFNISPTYAQCQNIRSVIEYVKKWETQRQQLPFETDGVVVKVNDFVQQQKLGLTAKHPRWAIAYKYKPQQLISPLTGITYQVGRTGVITPIAEFKPIFLGGTVVKRASLYNADEMSRLDLWAGDYVMIEKGGEVIPKVVGVDKTKRKKGSLPIHYITLCPACQSPLTRKEGEAMHYCPNNTSCPPQIKGRIEHFIQRKAMNIDSLGKKTIEQLYRSKKIKAPVDLYTLNRDTLTTLDGFKELSINKLLSGIEQSKAMPFEILVFAIGIRHVGKTTAEKLAQHFRSIEKLAGATYEQLMDVPEVGEKIAQSVQDFFHDSQNKIEINRLKKIGLQLSIKESDTKKKNTLNNQSFVPSGVFERYSRDEIKALIIAHNGRVLSGVSGKLNYLIAGKNAGETKLKKATNMGVKIISEEDFEAMINPAKV